MSAKTVFFHCAQPVLNSNGEFVLTPAGNIQKKAPTHTLAFEKYGDNGIIMGWAKAHTNDSYCKRDGVLIASERIEQVQNRMENYPDRKIMVISEITESHLPSKVIDDSFDYFFEKAVAKLIDLDAHDTVNLYFKTVKTTNTVCMIELDSQNIKDSIDDTMQRKIMAEKDTDDNLSEFIFATYYDNDELRVVVQERSAFYSTGLNVKSTEGIVDSFDILLATAGFAVLNEDELIFTHDTYSELTVIRTMKDLGLNYDFNLESEFVK